MTDRVLSRAADAPRPLARVLRPPLALARVLYEAGRATMRDGGLELGGHLAFIGLLSLFPFLIFLTALAGFLSDEQSAERFVSLMLDFLPRDVAGTLTPVAREILSTERAGLLTLGVIGSLWPASSGIETLRSVLNTVYRVERWRPIWWRRLQALALVGALALALLAASVALVLGPALWRLMTGMLGLDLGSGMVWLVTRYAVGVTFLLAVVLALHRWLPNVRQSWAFILPGALVTLALWVAVSSALSFYFGHFANYSATYGTLGGIVMTLLFFYAAALAFIYGAEVNAVRRRGEDQSS